MKHPAPVVAVIALLLATSTAVILPAPALAAQGYDNCTGFIDSLPATIGTQGTWCLRHDLATGLDSGSALTIATSNVTVDCNDFKFGGLTAGAGTQAIGIHASSQSNTVIRHCNIRGFHYGVALADHSQGSVVELNRFDGNTAVAIFVEGDNSLVRTNSINDTGGSTLRPLVLDGMDFGAVGIYTGSVVDIRDNSVSGVAPLAGADAGAIGIYAGNNGGGSIDGNRIRGLVPSGSGPVYGIDSAWSIHVAIGNNVVVGNSVGSGVGCTDDQTRAIDNIINGFPAAIVGCRDDGNSL